MARPKKPVEPIIVEVEKGYTRTTHKPAPLCCRWSMQYADGDSCLSVIGGSTRLVLKELRRVERFTRQFVLTDDQGRIRTYENASDLEIDWASDFGA